MSIRLDTRLVTLSARDWAKLDPSSLEARLGEKAKLVFQYRQLQDQLQRTEQQYDTTVVQTVTTHPEYCRLVQLKAQLEVSPDADSKEQLERVNEQLFELACTIEKDLFREFQKLEARVDDAGDITIAGKAAPHFLPITLTVQEWVSLGLDPEILELRLLKYMRSFTRYREAQEQFQEAALNMYGTFKQRLNASEPYQNVLVKETATERRIQKLYAKLSSSDQEKLQQIEDGLQYVAFQLRNRVLTQNLLEEYQQAYRGLLSLKRELLQANFNPGELDSLKQAESELKSLRDEKFNLAQAINDQLRSEINELNTQVKTAGSTAIDGALALSEVEKLTTVRSLAALGLDPSELQARFGKQAELIVKYQELEKKVQKYKEQIDVKIEEKVQQDFSGACLATAKKELESRITELLQEQKKSPSDERAAFIKELQTDLKETDRLILPFVQRARQACLIELKSLEADVRIAGGARVTPMQTRREKQADATKTSYWQFSSWRNPFSRTVRVESPTTDAFDYFNGIRSKCTETIPSNLEFFDLGPTSREVEDAIELFEKEANGVSMGSEIENHARRQIKLAFVMGSLALDDLATLRSSHPELADKTPAEIFADKTCYLSYFLQKAKNSLSCWPVEQEFLALSDELIELSKTLDKELTEKASHLGITLSPDYSLPSMFYQGTRDTSGYSFEDDLA